MNKISQLRCLSRRLLVLVVMAGSLLSVANSVSAQEAFYIYRNDGDFNGFFFDQVKRIGYSKIDLDSIEHDIYVVQEVETADSLYRIPLAAIDSVGFVQPEIIFNPRLKNLSGTKANGFSAPRRGARRAPEGECISDWVRKFEYGWLYFDLNTPKDLIPEVGDVLVDFDNPMFKKDSYIEDADYSGFAGKVTYVWAISDYLIVRTDPLTDLSDIFVQFISTEEVYEDEEGNEVRRLAGFDSDNGPRKAQGGTGNLQLLDISASLKHDFDIGSGKLGVELGAALGVKLAAVYNITATSAFIKTIAVEDFSLQASFSGKFDGDSEYELTGLPKRLTSIKFPAAAPLFQTNPLPMAFLRVKGEMGAKLSLPKLGFRAKQSIVVDTDSPHLMSGSCTLEGPDGEPQKGLLDGTDLSFYLNGSVQMGVKLSSNIYTNDWIEDLFQWGITADLYVGPQVDGSLSASTSLKDILSSESPSLYGSMKDSYISLTGIAANAEVKGRLKLLGDSDDQTFFEGNRRYFEKKWTLFPEFNDFDAQYNPLTGDIDVSYKASSPVFLPTTLGAAVYHKNYDDWYWNAPILDDKAFGNGTYFLFEDKNNTFEHSFGGLAPGIYRVYPYIKTAGYEVSCDIPYRQITVLPQLQIGKDEKRDSVALSREKHELEYTIRCNNDPQWIKILVERDSIYYGPSATLWASPELKNYDAATQTAKLVITVGENRDFWPRMCDIILKSSLDDDLFVADTVRIRQERGTSEITHIGVRLNYPRCVVSTHSWGVDHNGESWSNKEEKESEGLAGTYHMSYEDGQISSSINGNLLVVSGTYHLPNGQSPEYTGTGTAAEFHVVVDVTMPPGKVLSGYYNEDYNNVYHYKKVDTGSSGFTYIDEDWATDNNHTRVTWSQEVPYYSNNHGGTFSWCDYPNGLMWFRQEGGYKGATHEATTSGKYKWYANYNRTWYGEGTTTSNTESSITETDFGEDTTIDIILGY